MPSHRGLPPATSSQVRSAWRARSYEDIEHPAKPSATTSRQSRESVIRQTSSAAAGCSTSCLQLSPLPQEPVDHVPGVGLLLARGGWGLGRWYRLCCRLWATRRYRRLCWYLSVAVSTAARSWRGLRFLRCWRRLRLCDWSAQRIQRAAAGNGGDQKREQSWPGKAGLSHPGAAE